MFNQFKLFIWHNVAPLHGYGIIVDSATTEEGARQDAIRDATIRFRETGQSPEGLQRLIDALTKPADEVRDLTSADIVKKVANL